MQAWAKSGPSRHDAPDKLQREDECANDQRPFDEDVIAPVFWEWRVRLRHRAISHVVPSLESLMTTPIAASSSRIRSDSLKSFRARAALRAAIDALTTSLFITTALGSLSRYCFLVLPSNPSSMADALSLLLTSICNCPDVPTRLAAIAWRRVIAAAVLRSSPRTAFMLSSASSVG